MKTILRAAALSLPIYIFGYNIAVADTLDQFFAKSQITGQIRSYYFTRSFGTPDHRNAYAYTLAGRLNVLTAPFLSGFRVGVSFYTASSLGTFTNVPQRWDATLMGNRNSLNALGQAYLEYSDPWVTAKVGDQIFASPWLNRVGGRVFPATYQGASLVVRPLPGLQLEGFRFFRWKDRTSDDYYSDNLYYHTDVSDSLYGGPSVLPANAPSSNGALGFGMKYHLAGFHTQAWFYRFYQFDNLAYWSGSYALPTHFFLRPFLDAQFTRAWGAGQMFQNTDSQPLPYDTSPNQIGVNSTNWGLRVGVRFPRGSLWYAYSSTLLHPGTLGAGAIISPYTVGYTADPIYVDGMIQGLVGVGPGHGWRVRAAYWPIRHKLLLDAGFSQYNTYFTGASYWTHVNVAYHPGGMFKGLILRDQMEVGNGGVPALYPGAGQHSVIFNRVMFTYKF